MNLMLIGILLASSIVAAHAQNSYLDESSLACSDFKKDDAGWTNHK